MKITKKRNYPYIFKSKFKNLAFSIDGKYITFQNGTYETSDVELASKLRERAKRTDTFRELSAVGIYQMFKKDEEKKEPETVEQAIKKVTERKKKTYPCPECGLDLPSTNALVKHKEMKHPEKYLMDKVVEYIKERNNRLKKELLMGNKKKKVAKRKQK